MVSQSAHPSQVDVLVVGAGVAGIYMLYKLRKAGFSTIALEKSSDVGGTWYWNRYPGCQCDIQSIDYSYSFDRELELTWEWTSKYPTQPEVLKYLQHVAERHDLRQFIKFQCQVTEARWNSTDSSWIVRTANDEVYHARFVVMASGALSQPKNPEIPNLDTFEGDVYLTARWPHTKVDFTGKRVGVVGTGSSGVQVIPKLAAQAAELTVFQRTPCFSFPARNGPIRPELVEKFRADIDAHRETTRKSSWGFILENSGKGVFDFSDEERNAKLNEFWADGNVFGSVAYFTDAVTNKAANDELVKFAHSKIREKVDDPETAKKLCADTYAYATKRLCLDTNYYETFNKSHVKLIDLRQDPFVGATKDGIETEQNSVQLDALVLAMGFDALTGALTAINIVGEGGQTLKEKWSHRVTSYLGIMCAGFPNMFTITGPTSPSVLSNMMPSIEQHVEFIAAALEYVREKGMDSISATPYAEERWVEHSNDVASHTLFTKSESWYMGKNVPGKPTGLLAYVGGLGPYIAACDEVVSRDYLGFEFRGQGRILCNDGAIRPLRADAQVFVDMVSNFPSVVTLEPAKLRAMFHSEVPQLPPGARDGVYKGADGTQQNWRLYMPPNVEEPRLVVFFHGGGFVMGNETNDQSLCLELCSNSDAAILSVNYSHGPEARFPAAHDDAIAAVKWATAHTKELGVSDAPIVVAGLSAGANLAIEATNAGVDVCGRLLIVPFIDTDMENCSYRTFGREGGLDKSIMQYFVRHAADKKYWTNERFAPLRAPVKSHTPPTAIFTAEVDPLRDEGRAYAAKLAEAGIDVVHVEARGHTHITIGQPVLVPSSAVIHKRMSHEIKRFFSSS